MVVDIEKEKVKVLKQDFSFIKECLWPGKMQTRLGRI